MDGRMERRRRLRSASFADPFTPETTPLKLIAKARKLAEWTVAWNGVAAFDPPPSPIPSHPRLRLLSSLPKRENSQNGRSHGTASPPSIRLLRRSLRTRDYAS